MKDSDKTKEQLINELEEMRQRVAGLDITERKQAEEEELRKTRDYLDSLIRHASAPIIVWDTKARITIFNTAFERLAGYMAGEVMGQSLSMLFPEVNREESLAKIRRTASGEYWESVEIPIRSKDGEIRIVLWNSANIYDKSGKTVLATIAQGIDITERKKAEERTEHLSLVLRAIRNVNQLITKERDRKKLLKGSCKNLTESRGYYSAWIALLDGSGKLTEYAESGVGRSFQPMVERLKQGRLPACGQTALKQSEAVVTEDPASICTDCPLSGNYTGRGGMTARLEHVGEVYGLLSVSVPLELANDEEELGLFHEVAGDIAFALNNIEMEKYRKQAEEEGVSLAKFPSENPNPVFRVSKDDTILYANGPGLPLLDALGCSVGQSAPEYWHKLILDTLDSGSRETTEIECQERIFSLLFAPVTEAGYVNIYGLDITERKQTEEELKNHRDHLEALVEERTRELRKAQEELLRLERLATLGQFSGSISHELRNPLGVIDSSVYYLKSKLKGLDEKTLEHLDRIRSAVSSSTAIIESVLNLTRMKAPQLEKLDLAAVTSDAIDTSRVPASIKVVKELPEQEVTVSADEEQLRMAFKNIVKNAVQAMDGEGMLTVAVRVTAAGQAEITFADTGAGIAPENLSKVFEPLFSTKAKGIGFGLSIVKMVIDKHGGTVAAESELGKGAIITIRLPLYSGGNNKEGISND